MNRIEGLLARSFEIGTGTIIDSQEEFPGEWP